MALSRYSSGEVPRKGDLVTCIVSEEVFIHIVTGIDGYELTLYGPNCEECLESVEEPCCYADPTEWKLVARGKPLWAPRT